jgi:hypothetical protein
VNTAGSPRPLVTGTASSLGFPISGPASIQTCLTDRAYRSMTFPMSFLSKVLHRIFSGLPPVCRKAPAAVAVQGRHQVPSRFHKGPGSCRSGGAGPRSPRTCCRRVSAADSPGSLRQPQLPSGTWIRQRTLPVGALGGRYVCCPAVRSAHRRFLNRRSSGSRRGWVIPWYDPSLPAVLLTCTGPARLFRPGRDHTYVQYPGY